MVHTTIGQPISSHTCGWKGGRIIGPNWRTIAGFDQRWSRGIWPNLTISFGSLHLLAIKPMYSEHFDHSWPQSWQQDLTKFDPLFSWLFWDDFDHLRRSSLTSMTKLHCGWFVVALTSIDFLFRAINCFIKFTDLIGLFWLSFGNSIFDFIVLSLSLLNIWYNNKNNWSKGFPHLGVFPWHSPNLVFYSLGLSSAFGYLCFIYTYCQYDLWLMWLLLETKLEIFISLLRNIEVIVKSIEHSTVI